MNSLLARQLRKYLPDIKADQEPWKSFLGAVDNAYLELQQDRDHMERTLELTSHELTEVNEKLRQESARRIEDLSAYFRQTLEMQEGMILCFREDKGRFLHTLCRGRLAVRLGWNADVVEGKDLEHFMDDHSARHLGEVYRRAWAGEYCSIEHQVGDITFLALFRARRDDAGVSEVIVSCVEITALKQFERELLASKERAESADKAKSQFLAVMSHEIRTPLNAILGFTELLLESNPTAQQEGWLKTIGSSGESLRELIEEILDFSKIEAGIIELKQNRVVTKDLIRSVVALLEPKAKSKGIELVVELEPSLPESFIADGQRLRQVLVNLAGNAVKFTQNGRVTIKAQAVSRGAGAGDELHLRFFVADTGIGIRQEHRERMFKPFSQADSSSTRVYGGTGLGLAISKRLVELMGGAIDFSSEFGVGTTFFFNITAGRDASVSDKLPLRAAPPVGPKGLHVLVAEDRPANRDLLREILGRFECHVDFAEDGRLAVQAATHKRFDLIIMDLQMPEMDGFEATLRIRENQEFGSQPRIVALTASTLSEQHARCREVGMDAVLTKPLRFDALRSELLKVANPVAG